MKPLLLLKKEECKEISDNDFYLVNDTTIRKEYKEITGQTEIAVHMLN